MANTETVNKNRENNTKSCVCGHEMTKHEWKNQWVCHRCGRTKLVQEYMTNADRIRNMSDEELAEAIIENMDCNDFCKHYCEYYNGLYCEFNHVCTEEFAIKNALNWLQKEVER